VLHACAYQTVKGGVLLETRRRPQGKLLLNSLGGALPGIAKIFDTFSHIVTEREIYFKSHISLWEHSSHFRLIGRGVPSVSVVSQLVYKFLCLASPKENP